MVLKGSLNKYNDYLNSWEGWKDRLGYEISIKLIIF